MLIKYKHTEYFAVSDLDFSQIRGSNDLFCLIDENKIVAGFGGFEMVFALSRIFFHDEKHIPEELENKIIDISRVFQFKRDFIDKIASFEREEMDLFASLLREDKFCRKYNFVGMGIWVFLYELHDCCSLAVKENINLYLVEENSEYIMER